MAQQAQVRQSGSVRQAVQEFFAAERRNGEKIQKFELGLSDDDELPPYVHKDYPKAMHAIDGDSCVVANLKEEQEKLQEGFYSTYAEAQHAAEAYFAQEQEAEFAAAQAAQPFVGTAQAPMPQSPDGVGAPFCGVRQKPARLDRKFSRSALPPAKNARCCAPAPSRPNVLNAIGNTPISP